MCHFSGSIHTHKRSIKVIRKFTTLSLLEGKKYSVIADDSYQKAHWSRKWEIIKTFFQIRTLGNQTNCCRHNCRHLDARRLCVVCANLFFAPPSWTAACVWGQGWQRVSNVRTWPYTNVCGCVQLYKFLRSLYSYDRHLLQVCAELLFEKIDKMLDI